MFTTEFETIDMLLEEAGVMSGETVTLYHRAYASNGSVATAGPAASVMFSRGVVTNIDENGHIPQNFSLNQNYPNPFNPTTQISFTLPEAGLTTLEVYNMLGQRVATLVNNDMSAGTHSVNFNAEALSSGVYIYRLTAGNTSLTRKMMLVK